MTGNPRDLGPGLQRLTRSIRLLKQSHAERRPAVPLSAMGMLAQIERWPAGCHARELAHCTSLEPSTVSRTVAYLVAHGLVERHPDPTDGRATVLALTAAGRAAVSETRDWYGQVLDHALADWTPAELATLSAALDRFTHDIELALGSHDTLEAAR
ncbi:MarR family winged helix-turn-helix transcriptional regulator [Krasilnikovia sp. MM14-A1004]|uniref:MarR family winged helix-turn-helix transcriptional regulator n=1 Tax=Krasilnikovia sp. MM14-A1004 TaxID=3373541 RepID=UPI00399CDF36